MQAIFFALISYIGWGAGDIFGAITTRKIGAFSTSFWVSIVGVLVFSLYIPFAAADLQKYNSYLLFLNIILGSMYVVVNVMINKAFAVSNVSLIGTIFSSFAAFTALFALIFLGEKVSINQGIAILIVLAGIFLSTVDFKELKKGNLIADHGVRLAMVAMIFASLYFTFIRIPMQKVGWFWPNYLSILLFPLVGIYMKARKIKLEKPNLKNAFWPIIICTLLLRFGDFAYNIGISRGLTAIVVPIAGAYPTLFAVLGFLIFKDPIRRQQILGIVVTLVGIVFLSLLSI